MLWWFKAVAVDDLGFLTKNVDVNLGLYTFILQNPHKKLDMVIGGAPFFAMSKPNRWFSGE